MFLILEGEIYRGFFFYIEDVVLLFLFMVGFCRFADLVVVVSCCWEELFNSNYFKIR